MPSLANAFQPGDVFAGIVSALLTICYGVVYSSMIFSGSLSDLASVGMTVVLVSCVVITFVTSLKSSLPFAIGGPDANATAILAGVTAGVAAVVSQAHGNTSPMILSTVLMTIACTALLTGVLQYVIGISRRSAVIQFLPFPVLGGFLGGAGFLAASGAYRMLTGEPLGWSTLSAAVQIPWLEWMPAVLTCVVLYVASNRMKIATVPLGLLIGSLVFFGALYASGATLESAHRMGLLYHTVPLSQLTLPERMSFASIDWSAIATQLPGIVVVAIVSSITILLNMSSLSTSENIEIDLDRELSAAGLSNIAAGLLGGIPGNHSLTRTNVNLQAGARTRLSGYLCALICLAVAAGVPQLLDWLPKPVLAGMQLFVAVKLLQEWLVRSYKRLSPSEYLLIPLIVVVIAVEGVAIGVVVGIVAACVLFALSYSRIGIVRSEFDGMTRHSNVERSLEERELLNSHARQVVGICLQGFLFFGTASRVLEHLRERLDRAPRQPGGPRFIVIDFAQVDGLDASTALTFHKLDRYCAKNKVMLVLTAVPEQIHANLTRGGKGITEPSDTVEIFADLDSGLESIEMQLLGAMRPPCSGEEASVRSQLSLHFSAEALDTLERRLEPLRLEAGQTLFHKGDAGDAVYLVERGHVTVSLALDSGKRLRLRSYGAGTVLGEMALYTQQLRSADVTADVVTHVRRLSLEALQELEREAPDTAREFHRFIVKLLATRLATANDALRALH